MKDTIYNGIAFKTKHAARWAYFFDCINLEYRYREITCSEKWVSYTPDFYFPDSGYYGNVSTDVIPQKRQYELLTMTTRDRECSDGIILLGSMPANKLLNDTWDYIGFPIIYNICPNPKEDYEDRWCAYNIVVLRHSFKKENYLTFGTCMERCYIDRVKFYEYVPDPIKNNFLPYDARKPDVYFIKDERNTQISFVCNDNGKNFKRYYGEIGDDYCIPKWLMVLRLQKK